MRTPHSEAKHRKYHLKWQYYYLLCGLYPILRSAVGKTHDLLSVSAIIYPRWTATGSIQLLKSRACARNINGGGGGFNTNIFLTKKGKRTPCCSLKSKDRNLCPPTYECHIITEWQGEFCALDQPYLPYLHAIITRIHYIKFISMNLKNMPWLEQLFILGALSCNSFFKFSSGCIMSWFDMWLRLSIDTHLRSKGNDI